MHLKGGGEDALVLTTGDATYAVQLVETSNTVLPTRVLESDASAAGAGERVSFVIEGSVGGVMQVRWRWGARGERAAPTFASMLPRPRHCIPRSLRVRA